MIYFGGFIGKPSRRRTKITGKSPEKAKNDKLFTNKTAKKSELFANFIVEKLITGEKATKMKHFEILPPNLWLEELKNWRGNLKIALHTMESRKISAGTPEISGHLRISATKQGPQYYHVEKRGDTQGKYIPKENIKLIKQLAQQDYDRKTLAALKKEIKLLDTFLKKYEAWSPVGKYSKLLPERQELITPITLLDKQYAQEWQKITYVGKQIGQEVKEFFTNQDEKVRSKSEVIIANELHAAGIPYRYEYPVKLKNYKLHPDFYCLNLRLRQEIVWEHFGLMDISEYANNAVSKLNDYQSSGFILGRNLIITAETSQNPLTVRQVRSVIKNYLL